MTLLKVLYFSHAWYLVRHAQPLIGQPFEAWRHGPVIRVVYEQTKKYGDQPIDQHLEKLDISTGELSAATLRFDKETEAFLSNIFDYYAKFHAFALSDLTHERGGPWDVVWTAAASRALPGMVIPNKIIKEWFERAEGRTSVKR